MSGKRMVFLALAVAGLTATWYHNLAFMLGDGVGLSLWAFFQAGFVNHAAASLSVDLLIAAATGVVWMSWEARRLEMPHLWVYYLATAIAFAFAFPLFLCHRELYLRRG